MLIDRTPFMSRNGLAAMRLARQFLALPVGAQLPKAKDMAAELGYGNGTIQAGLKLLEDAGAIATTARGRLGTYLDRADRAMLWDIAGMGSLTLAMPLPYTRRYEGLASGLRRAFELAEIPFSLTYMRGSAARIAALVDGRVDIAVMSRLAFDIGAENQPVTVIADLGPGSYVGSHGVVLAEGVTMADRGLRVAVDRASADQTHMVDLVFGHRDDVELVDVSYQRLADGFANRTIDATMWNLDEIDQRVAVPVSVAPLAELDVAVDERNTAAVLVVAEDSTRVPAAFFSELNLDAVMEVLEDVLQGRAVPRY